MEGYTFFETPWGGHRVHMVFFYGARRNYEIELLQKDCETPINDTEITLEHISTGRNNFTSWGFGASFLFDNSTITSSRIFNIETWELEFCAYATLVSDSGAIEAEDKDVITGFIDVSNSLIRPVSTIHDVSMLMFEDLT